MKIEELNRIFREKGRTLGSVESFTGGKFAAEVVAVPGASHFFKGALVTYMNETKKRVLSIPYKLMDEVGVVSGEVAAAMCGNGSRILGVDYCVSFTGNAGPEALEGKPVGRVYVGLTAYNLTRVYELNLEGTREEIIDQAIDKAIDLLLKLIEEKN